MKKTRIRIFFLPFLLVLLTGPFPLLHETAKAQEKTDTSKTVPLEITPGMEFSYLCTSDDSVLLTARLTYRRDRDIIALEYAKVDFSAGNDKINNKLASVRTDSTGTASVKVSVKNGVPSGTAGVIRYGASFAGEGKYLAASESFQAKPARLVVAFFEQDSVKTVRVTASQEDKNGVWIPVGGQTVKLYVPSLYRPLPIGEIALDESGTGTLEFPKTLVGDSLGNIVVMAQIEENDLFGNVLGKNTINWAVPKHLIPQDKPSRELWTPVAPLWMIITLVILLAGVWAHYVYAVIQLIKIKRSSKVNTLADKY
jgi:hypothetical protein